MKKISLLMLMVVSILPLTSLSASEQVKEQQPEVNQQLDQEQNVVVNANNFVVAANKQLDVASAIELASANVENVTTDLVVNERQLQAINDNQDGGFFTLTFSCGEANKTVSVVKLGTTVVGNEELFITARDVTYSQDAFNNIVNNNDVTQIIADATAQAINVATGATDTAFNVTFNNNQVTFTKDGVSKVINVNVVEETPATREVAPVAETVTLTAQNKVLYQDEAQQQIKTVDDLKTVLGLTSTPDKNAEVTVDAGANFNKIKNGAISYDGYDITFNFADQSVTKKLYIVDKENCAVSKDQKTFIRLFDTYVQTYSYQLWKGNWAKPIKKATDTPDIKTEQDMYNVSYALVVSDGQVIPYPNDKVSLTGFDDVNANTGKEAKVDVALSYTTPGGESLTLNKKMDLVRCDYDEYPPNPNNTFWPNGRITQAGDGVTKDHLGKLSLKRNPIVHSSTTIKEAISKTGNINRWAMESFEPVLEYRGQVYENATTVTIDEETVTNLITGRINEMGYQIGFNAALSDPRYPEAVGTCFGRVTITKPKPDDVSPILVLANNYVDKQSEAVNDKAELVSRMQGKAYLINSELKDVEVSINKEEQFKNKVIGDYKVTFTAKSGDLTGSATLTYSIVSDDSIITKDHKGYIYTEKQNIGRLQSDVIGKINNREDILDLLGITAMYDGEARPVGIEVLTGNFYDIKEGELGSYQFRVQVSNPALADYMIGERIFTIYDNQTSVSNGYAIRADNISKHVSEVPLTPAQVLELSNAKAWKVDGTNNNVPIKVDEAQLAAIVAVGDYPLDLITDEQPTNTRAGDVVVGNPGVKQINVNVWGDPEQPVAPEAPAPVVTEQPAPQIPTGVKNTVISLGLVVAIAAIGLVLTKRNRK